MGMCEVTCVYVLWSHVWVCVESHVWVCVVCICLQGQYLDALHCYSACIEARPDQVAGYTNRALCHLKLASVSTVITQCFLGLL